MTYFVVFVERGQRKIWSTTRAVQVGNKVYGGQSSHLPLKLNMAGVIPRSLPRPSSCCRHRGELVQCRRIHALVA